MMDIQPALLHRLSAIFQSGDGISCTSIRKSACLFSLINKACGYINTIANFASVNNVNPKKWVFASWLCINILMYLNGEDALMGIDTGVSQGRNLREGV